MISETENKNVWPVTGGHYSSGVFAFDDPNCNINGGIKDFINKKIESAEFKKKDTMDYYERQRMIGAIGAYKSVLEYLEDKDDV